MREPKIYPAGTGWQGSFWFTRKDGQRVRFRKLIASSGSRRDAERLVKELAKAAERLGYVPGFEEASTEREHTGGPLPMSKALAMFEELHVKVNNAPSEQRNKRAVIRDYIKPYFERLGDPDARDVTVTHCLGLQAELTRAKQKAGTRKGKPLSNSRINKIMDTVKTLFNWLIRLEEYGIEKSPMRREKVRHLDVREYEAVTWTGEQLLRFADVCRRREPHWLGFYVLAANTGMRLGELIALIWSDVKLDEGYIRVQRSNWRGQEKGTKGKRNRSIPLTEPLVEFLRERKTECKGPRVFTTVEGHDLTENSVRKPFYRVCRAAGLPHIRIHDLRHSFATLIHEQGTPLDVVQKLLGHSTILMTMRYAKTPPEAERKAVNLFSTQFNMLETGIQLESEPSDGAKPELLQ